MSWLRCLAVVLVLLCFDRTEAAEGRFPMTFEQVHAVQTVLFELGFFAGSDYPDGKFGPKTKQAISKFQGENGQPATGYFTKDQFDQFMSKTLPPRIRGAVSASTTGAYHSVWNYPSAMQAYDAARSKCLEVAPSCATIASKEWILGGRCIRVIPGEEYTRTISFVHVQPASSAEEALELFYEAAYSDSDRFRPEECSVLTLISADGSHDN